MLTKRISIIASIIAILLLAFFIITTMFSKPITGPASENVSFISIEKPKSDTAFGGIFADHGFINDSLPHYQYKQKLDIFEKIQKERSRENESRVFAGHAVGSFGVAVFEAPGQWMQRHLRFNKLLDSLDNVNSEQDKGKSPTINVYPTLTQQEEDEQQNLYYISLKGYDLEKDTRFFIQNGTYNLAYVQWDSIKNEKKSDYRYGHYEQKKIPVRYSAERKMIFIPISLRQHHFISLCLRIGLSVLLLFSIYITIYLPIQVLVNIAKGEAFIPKNIRNLKIIAYSAMALSLLAITTPYIFHFFFHRQIPANFQLESFTTAFFNQLYWLFAAIALFSISKAFEKGYKLQEEQNLTI